MNVAVLCVLLTFATFVYCQIPQPCTAPAQWTGKFFKRVHQLEAQKRFREQGVIFYDSSNERIAFYRKTIGISDLYKEILLFKEEVHYFIDEDTKFCTKEILTEPFIPIHVPINATFLGEFFLGTSSIDDEGVLVENWRGFYAEVAGDYEILVTVDSCIPVNDRFFDQDNLEAVENFYYDIVSGITDPEVFIPPGDCQ